MQITSNNSVPSKRVATRGLLQRVAVVQENCTALIKVRVRPEFKHRLVTHAQARGLEFSGWVRQALRLQADREATYGASPVFVEEADERALHPPAPKLLSLKPILNKEEA